MHRFRPRPRIWRVNVKSAQPHDRRRKAYAKAERLIAKEKEERTGELDLSNDEFKALSKLPSDISDLDWLSTLRLNNTQIESLEPVSMLTALVLLELKNTSIIDLTPLETLESLRWLNLS